MISQIRETWLNCSHLQKTSDLFKTRPYLVRTWECPDAQHPALGLQSNGKRRWQFGWREQSITLLNWIRFQPFDKPVPSLKMTLLPAVCPMTRRTGPMTLALSIIDPLRLLGRPFATPTRLSNPGCRPGKVQYSPCRPDLPHPWQSGPGRGFQSLLLAGCRACFY